MKRRTVLLLGGGLVSTPAGILAWNWLTGPTLPPGMSVETLNVVKDTVDRPRRKIKHHEAYSRIIAERDTAKQLLSDVNEFQPFISDTDFNHSYLLLIQSGASSDTSLQLRSIQRSSEGLAVTVAITYPLSGHVVSDLTVHSLLIRITDDHRAVPHTVTVDITE